MCFGRSDSDLEGEQMTTHGKLHAPKLKRRRSPAEADHSEPQDARKLSKLDSTASTLANDWSMSPTQLSGTRKISQLSSSSPNNADNNSSRIEELQSSRITQERTSLSSGLTLPLPVIDDDTTLDCRTALIESYHASEELRIHSFRHFIDLPYFSSLHLQLLRSTKMKNDDLAACFDLISKTSQQDYKASSRGWNPTVKMEEMQDKDMMYLLVRQAEGYLGVDKVDGQEPRETQTGAVLGFLSFKLEPEDEEMSKMRSVLYIYEIHLDDRLRGQNLGGRMIRWAESQACLVKITKMMLTVFTVNEGARRLYKREGFVTDESSPEDRVTRRKVIKADYIIMSKELE